MPIDLNTDVASLARQLADHEAIRSLPQRYCDSVWRRDPDAMADLFTRECRLDLGAIGRPLTSPDEIRSELAQSVGSGDTTARPFIHNVVFDVDGDRASGRSYLEVRVTMDGATRTGVGFYDDEYAREDGVWKFKSRKAQFITSPRP